MARLKKTMEDIAEHMRFVQEELTKAFIKQQSMLAGLQQKIIELQNRVSELESALQGINQLKWMKKHFDVKIFSDSEV